MTEIIKETGNILVNWVVPFLKSTKEHADTVVIREIETMVATPGLIFVRLAGLSGAVAVGLGAYGAHAFRESEADPKLKLTFDTGNRYHFLHTIALMGVPLASKPYLTGTLMLTGMTLFSGSCYYHALTGSTAIRKVTPYGGMMLIAAWLAMAL